MSEIYLYDYVDIDPYWGDEVYYVIGQGKLSSSVVVPQIKSFSGELHVRVNSQGGSVFHGWAIYNALVEYRKIPGNTIIVHIDALAASIAGVISMAGNEVIMAQASLIMVHKASGFYFGQMDADELQSEANSLNEIEKVLVDIFATKTNLPAAKLQSMIDAETWLSPETALALGFCDKIDKVEADKPEIPENVFNKLFSKGNESTRIYANSIFNKTNSKDMSTVKELADKQDKTNSLLDNLLNLFKAKNEVEPVVEPEVEPVTPGVVEPLEDVAALKQRIAELEAEKTADKEKVDNAQGILDKANEMYDKVQNQLAEVRSNYKPEAAAPVFNSKADPEKNTRFSHLKSE